MNLMLLSVVVTGLGVCCVGVLLWFAQDLWRDGSHGGALAEAFLATLAALATLALWIRP